MWWRSFGGIIATLAWICKAGQPSAQPTGAPSDLCRKQQIACSAALRIFLHICICAGARPRIRLCDESPDGDLALPCPRRAQASPGVASTPPPTLRVSSPRRSRMRPAPHTNIHEWIHKAHSHVRQPEIVRQLGTMLSRQFGQYSCSPAGAHSWLGGRRKPAGLERRLDGGPGKA